MMENQNDKAHSTSESTPAKLVGYINPLGMIPSFLVPVFQRNGELVLQESNPNETIKGFYPYDEEAFGKLGRLNLKISANAGDETIYGFVFPSGALAVGTKQAVAERLLKQRKTLSNYDFLYMEVLDFLGRYTDLDAHLEKAKQEYSSNPLLAIWSGLERRSISEKKTSLDEEIDIPEHRNDFNFGINLPHGFIRRVEEIRAKGKRPQRVGFVSSDKMIKTVVVRVDRVVLHPKYRRYVRRTGKFMAHDELGAAVGDKVRIMETRPLSARKRWRVVEIIQKASH
jgi:small subunit ribosomal protein S17